MSSAIVIVCSAPEVDARASAAALANAVIPREPPGGPPGTALLVDLTGVPLPRPGLLSAASARLLARSVPELVPVLTAVPRGRLCLATADGDRPAAEIAGELVSAPLPAPVVVCVEPSEFRAVLNSVGVAVGGVLVQATPSTPKQLLGLLAAELRSEGVPVAIWRHRPGAIQRRRALAGLDPGGETRLRARRAAGRLAAEAGQALPALLALIIGVLGFALALGAIGGAATAKGRAQRAVDLAAVSAARSMRDDFHRLFVPALGPDGRPDPAHLTRAEYLANARDVARKAARGNGLPAATVTVGWPDRESFAPLRVRVEARPRVRIPGSGPSKGPRTVVSATAVAVLADAAVVAAPPVADGGGYSGPLAYRQGEPMRPDVAAAFDRLATAAIGAGHALVINSAFRSDAEQARLFAANPDPRWVAPPGQSLHRCGTELDLGPAGAHRWLLAAAPGFGFARRYPWEPWHFGFVRGPAPCSGAAERATEQSGSGFPDGRERGGGGEARPGRGRGPGGDGRAAAGPGLPGFVPPEYRRPLLEAAGRYDVSAPLLAAQLMAESNFNPAAVSPAGARGIAQFMPATAAAYGLTDPFDPVGSIDAQARLMSDLLGRFASPSLALAAYNAGPAPVEACGCVPPYPETQAYVARILGLVGGGSAGTTAVAVPSLEVRLIR